MSVLHRRSELIIVPRSTQKVRVREARDRALIFGYTSGVRGGAIGVLGAILLAAPGLAAAGMSMRAAASSGPVATRIKRFVPR